VTKNKTIGGCSLSSFLMAEQRQKTIADHHEKWYKAWGVVSK
jgi:hypothetical protein